MAALSAEDRKKAEALKQQIADLENPNRQRCLRRWRSPIPR
jgi:hypothetical protein